MAQIKLKRGPSNNITSLVLGQGEPAFTTDTGKLYIGDGAGGKVLINPDGEITTHTGEVTGSTALSITAKAVTNAKMADMAANTIKGAVLPGVPVDLTVAQIKTMLGYLDDNSIIDGGTF